MNGEYFVLFGFSLLMSGISTYTMTLCLWQMHTNDTVYFHLFCFQKLFVVFSRSERAQNTEDYNVW